LASYNGFKSLKPFISKLLMCDLDRFSKIQSHIMYACTMQVSIIAVVQLADHGFHPFSCLLSCCSFGPVTDRLIG